MVYMTILGYSGQPSLLLNAVSTDWRPAAAERDCRWLPHQPPQNALAEEMGLTPARFLYLGDTNTDMKTAVAAGMFPVGALWGFRDAEELKAHGAKVLIESPMGLLGLL